MNNIDLKIWRLNPKSIRLEKAEKTLRGTANTAGVKWCKAYADANSLGYHVFPPVDIDITWHGGKDFEHTILEPWPATEHDIVKSITLKKDNVNPEDFCPASGRTHTSVGAVDNAVAQIWTGCIFKTLPGWCLQVRSPINCEPHPCYHVMEGILETDWMQYDIWLNLVFTKQDELVRIRKDQWPPIAQLIPIKREGVEGSCDIISDKPVNRDEPEDNEVFEYWLQYNHKKFSCGGKQQLGENRTKDSTTFWTERQKNLNKETLEAVPRKIKEISKSHKTKIPIFKRKR